MFLIAGVQPKTVALGGTARPCPICGLQRAREKRIDHYFSLFFLPLFRVKKGEPFLFCDRCNSPVEDGGFLSEEIPALKTCGHCGAPVNADFNYCPRCGKPLS